MHRLRLREAWGHACINTDFSKSKVPSVSNVDVSSIIGCELLGLWKRASSRRPSRYPVSPLGDPERTWETLPAVAKTWPKLDFTITSQIKVQYTGASRPLLVSITKYIWKLDSRRTSKPHRILTSKQGEPILCFHNASKLENIMELVML
jgi:hypothetical protein